MAISAVPQAYPDHVYTADSIAEIERPFFSFHWKRGVRQVHHAGAVYYVGVPIGRKWRGDNRSNHAAN